MLEKEKNCRGPAIGMSAELYQREIGKYINKEAFCYAETGQLRALASELICSSAWFFRCSRAR
ncbi:MAG: hypothetical protein II453_00415, partial [Alphaproteobacteria bacterium]|nr:hypothetical protein [Alphaproteobacteria bacterium]